jgi:predicted ATPase
MAFAHEHLQAAKQSHGRGIVVAGEAGIGKSALLDAIADLAITQGMRVRRGVGYPQTQELQTPFGLLQALVPTEELPQLTNSTTPLALTMVANRVLTHLVAQSSEQPVVWIIDDLQWADKSSATLLGFVARRLGADRVLVVFGLRTNEPLNLDLRGFPRLELTSLTEPQSAEVLIDQGCNPAIAAEHAALGGGLPLALVELAKQLNNGATTQKDLTLQIPQHYANVVNSLAPEVLRILSICALDDELRSILSVAKSGGAQYLGEAEDLDIIRVTGTRVIYRHPLLRAAVLNATSADTKRTIHRAFAEQLNPEIDADRIALHLGRAAEAPDDHAAAALGALGERARMRGAVSEAVLALERAASLARTREQQARHLLDAGNAMYFAGDAQRGIEYDERALQIGSASRPGKHVDL